MASSYLSTFTSWWTFTVTASCNNCSEVSQVLWFFLIYSSLLGRVILPLNLLLMTVKEAVVGENIFPCPGCTVPGLEGISEVMSLEAVFWYIQPPGSSGLNGFPFLVQPLQELTLPSGTHTSFFGRSKLNLVVPVSRWHLFPGLFTQWPWVCHLGLQRAPPNAAPYAF